MVRPHSEVAMSLGMIRVSLCAGGCLCESDWTMRTRVSARWGPGVTAQLCLLPVNQQSAPVRFPVCLNPKTFIAEPAMFEAPSFD